MFQAFADWLFDSTGLTPHGFCLFWDPWLIWTYALSDTGIALAYFSIPAALAVFARRRSDFGFRPLAWLFAAFILLCGTTHLLDVATLWVPAYGADALIKAATAVVSIVTAVVLWRILPEVLALPAPAQLQAVNAALRESEARHRAGFEHSPVPLQTLNGNGIITGVSNTWLSLLGYTADEVIGHHIGDFQAPGSEAWREVDRTVLMADGEVNGLERRFLRRDGAVVDTLVSARLDWRDNVPFIVCVFIDITQRRQAEEALRTVEERLRQSQKMEAVGQLTGGMAHDFNNMLQSIGAGLDLMEHRIAQGRTAELGGYLVATRQALDNASNVTKRLLAFARRQPLQPTVVEPDALIDGMVDLISRSLGTNVQVEVNLRDGTWSALCDPNQLENALLNLAINARDAMPDGGKLTIAAADRTFERSDLLGPDEAEPGCYVEIAVTDTGMGMAPDVLPHVFEPFFTTKPAGEGTGLGLSQIYGFVRQSGGFVRLESRVGHGTTVRLFLPRTEQAIADDTTPAGEHGAER